MLSEIKLTSLLTKGISKDGQTLNSFQALEMATINAAKALGLGDDRGTLQIGKRADLAIWNISQPAELAYWAGYNPLHTLVQGGNRVDFDAQLTSPGLAA